MRRNKSGVPILNRFKIEAIAEEMLGKFDPDVFTDPHEIDIDAFAQNFLGAHQSYEYLSNCGLYLGMTVFNDTDRVVIYDSERKCADYISVKANTIIIDRSLLEDGQKGRYRFTMGHECGHLALGHAVYFCNAGIGGPAVRCRDGYGTRSGDFRGWSDEDWMEWQADNFASCILIPARSVETLAGQIEEGEYPWLTGFDGLMEAVMDIFGVSGEAAGIRLRQLGYDKDWPNSDRDHIMSRPPLEVAERGFRWSKLRV